MAAQFNHNHPESQFHPENRHGTKTHRSYVGTYMLGNNVPNARLIADLTPRQEKKVWRAVHGDRTTRGFGRKLRAFHRYVLNNVYGD